MEKFDIIVIGAGQSGLAVGYYLRRTGLSYVLIDNQNEGGGSWLHAWNSLRLFSPAQWSSLPGMMMPGGSDYYPARDVVIEYLKHYATKYNLPIRRSEQVINVKRSADQFEVETSKNTYRSKVIISATGSFNNAVVPEIKGREKFGGLILHSSQYSSPQPFIKKKVAIVGEGNSGAQLLAEVSKVTKTIWIAQKEPRFLPDHIDGRYLFDVASQMYEAQKQGRPFRPPSLGDIVMVESVKEARTRKVLQSSSPPFDHFTEDSLVWVNGHKKKIDVVIFCTGFKPALKHLSALHVVNAEGKADTLGTRSKDIAGLWFVGYGNWTGFASATLIGVGRSAKKTVEEVTEYLSYEKNQLPNDVSH